MSAKVALITGASRGIGRAIAVALGQHGWRVAVNYQRNTESAQETVRQIEAFQGEALPIQGDISLTVDRQRLVDTVIDRLGQIDLLVNNAGMASRQRRDVLEVSEESYDEVMTLNLKGAFFLTQQVAKTMISLIQERLIDHPKIINIGSISAYASSLNRAEYCISKAGLAMVTTLFADRLAEWGIGVYEIRPGIIATDMTDPVKEKYDTLIANGVTPLRRWGQPEDVARAVVAIAEDALPFSTGEVINVDGGFHLRRL